MGLVTPAPAPAADASPPSAGALLRLSQAVWFPTVSALLGAVLGAAAGLGGSVIASNSAADQAHRLERRDAYAAYVASYTEWYQVVVSRDTPQPLPAVAVPQKLSAEELLQLQARLDELITRQGVVFLTGSRDTVEAVIRLQSYVEDKSDALINGKGSGPSLDAEALELFGAFLTLAREDVAD